MTAPRISLACPVYNEEDVLPLLIQRCLAVLDKLPGGPHQLVIVDDGSRDLTRSLLLDAAARDSRVTVVCLSRNFGHQAAMSAAIDHASGDAVLLMDGDLQDEPENLPVLLAKLNEGYDVVYARRSRRKESAWLRFSYHIAYRLIARLSQPALPVDAGDFALVTRRVVLAMRDLPERQRYLRGLRAWVGFRQFGVTVERAARGAGEPKYNLRRLIGLALDGAFAFSTAPLRLIGLAGGATLILTAAFAVFAVYARLAHGQTPRGFTALTVLGAALGGMILLSMWIIGEYVGRIYEEVKRRPVYIVDTVVGQTSDRP